MPLLATIRQTAAGIGDAFTARNPRLAGQIAIAGARLLVAQLRSLQLSDAGELPHSGLEPPAGFGFEFPIWGLAHRTGLWALRGNDGRRYLMLFSDRDAARTFVNRSRHIRPARIVQLDNGGQLRAFFINLSPKIDAVVWDRLPGTKQSPVSSRHEVLEYLCRPA